MPLACTLGDTCFIQNYVDHDPTEGIRDHTCHEATYNGHKGTDFALNNLAALSENISVRAARAGIVLGTRNTMPDIAINSPNAPVLNGKDCGNGVSIAHLDNTETQYCHMAQGSVSVKAGDRVERGAHLGFVGLSGNTEFPHLHFELRQDGKIIDPFMPQTTTSCAPQTMLWTPPVAASEGGIVTSGLATSVPEFSQVLAGLPEVVKMPPTLPALVSWVTLYNAQALDEIRFEIISDDRLILSETVTLERNQARVYRAVGKRAPQGADKWQNGPYSSKVTVLRDGEILDEETIFFRIDP